MKKKRLLRYSLNSFHFFHVACCFISPYTLAASGELRQHDDLCLFFSRRDSSCIYDYNSPFSLFYRGFFLIFFHSRVSRIFSNLRSRRSFQTSNLSYVLSVIYKSFYLFAIEVLSSLLFRSICHYALCIVLVNMGD